MHVDDLVDTVEMYLKAILELEEEGVVAIRARLADRFDQAGPSVSENVERMRRYGLVELDDERHLALTEAGRRRAASVMRKHRLAEVFLQRVVGLEWELLHEEACRWEHVMSDRVEQLLDDLLGHPESTPYGNPVQETDGTVRGQERRSPRSLVRLAVDAARPILVRLEWIGEPLQVDTVALRGLQDDGLVPGVEATITTQGGFVTVRSAGGDVDVTVPHAVAVHLFGTVVA